MSKQPLKQPWKARSSEHCRKASLKGWEGKRRPVEERFWEKVKRAGSDECWEWQGCTCNGYGAFSVSNRSQRSHRLAYEFSGFKIESDLCLLHKCDNRLCCNPNHLFQGTRSQNAGDRVAKGRQFLNVKRGADHRFAKLTEQTVIWLRTNLQRSNKWYREQAAKYGVNYSTIRGAAVGHTWRHI